MTRPVYIVTAGGTTTRDIRQELPDVVMALREVSWLRVQLTGLEGARVGCTDPYGVETADVFCRGEWRPVAHAIDATAPAGAEGTV